MMRRVAGMALACALTAAHAAALFRATCVVQQVDPRGLVLHADNGACGNHF